MGYPRFYPQKDEVIVDRRGASSYNRGTMVRNIHITSWKGIALLLAAAFIAAFIISGSTLVDEGGESALTNPGTERKITAEPTASLTVDKGNGERRSFEGAIVEGMSVADVLDVVASESFAVEMRDRGGAATLVSLDSIENSGSEEWRLYINDTLRTEPLNVIEVHDNDRIEFRYE